MPATRSLKLDQPPHETCWLIQNTLPRGEVVLLDGAAGVGKSCLATAFVAGISQGLQLAEGETILYISSPRQRELSLAFLHHHEPNYDRLRDVEYVLDPAVAESGKAWQPHFCEFLQAAIKEHKPALVVIDSLEELFEGSPYNDAFQWDDAWHCLHHIANAYDCTLLIPRRHGLHENRQYGPFTRVGSEVVRFILTMHYHPIDPLKRVITLAKHQTGPIGSQSLGLFHNKRLALIRLESHEHVRPARAPATWQPHDDTQQQENEEIIQVVETFLNGQPVLKRVVKQHVLDAGYSERAYHRAMGHAKLQSCKHSNNEWMFIPTLPMFVRAMNAQKTASDTTETPMNQPRARGAAGDDPQPAIAEPAASHQAHESRLAG